MSTQLHYLVNTTLDRKRRKRVGRGVGSGRGKTSTRGFKGAGSRSGWKEKLGKEGGRMPLFQTTPIRGFTRGRFQKKPLTISFSTIEHYYKDGETVSRETLHEKGLIPLNHVYGIKLLSDGDLTRKVVVEVDYYSEEARKKLEELSIRFIDKYSSAE